jgi:sugar-specific transcriptional regulator TrmB
MKVKIDRHIQDFLEDFELTEREISIYLTLLRTGPNTIMNISRETAIKRSTTHNNIEELIKKGLVSQTNFGERRMVVAEDPEKLKFLLEQRKWRMKKLEENLPTVVESISKIVPESKENTNVHVKYYDGKKGASYIYEQAFNSNELRSYVNLEEVSKTFPDNAEIFEEAQAKNGNLIVREIIDPSPRSKEMANEFTKFGNFEYKIANESLNLSSIDVLMFDNKVAMINFQESITATVIDNKDYYLNAIAIFDFVWKVI